MQAEESTRLEEVQGQLARMAAEAAAAHAEAEAAQRQLAAATAAAAERAKQLEEERRRGEMLRVESEAAREGSQREMATLLQALDGMRRERDLALARARDECERAREDSDRSLLQAEEQYQIAENELKKEREARQREQDRLTQALERQQLDTASLDRMLAAADALHADAIHEAAEIERALESLASTAAACDQMLAHVHTQVPGRTALLHEYRMQQERGAQGAPPAMAAVESEFARLDEGVAKPKEEQRGRDRCVDEIAAERERAAAAAAESERRREEAIQQKVEAEERAAAAVEEARGAWRQLEALREALQSSACCQIVRERLEAAEAREARSKEREWVARDECASLTDTLAALKARLEEAQAEAEEAKLALEICKGRCANTEELLAAAEGRAGEAALQAAARAAACEVCEAEVVEQRRAAAAREEELAEEARGLRATLARGEGERAELQASLDVAQQRILDAAVAASKLRLEQALGVAAAGVSGGDDGGVGCGWGGAPPIPLLISSNENVSPNVNADGCGDLIPRTPRGGAAVPGRTPVKARGHAGTPVRALWAAEAELEGAREQVRYKCVDLQLIGFALSCAGGQMERL